MSNLKRKTTMTAPATDTAPAKPQGISTPAAPSLDGSTPRVKIQDAQFPEELIGVLEIEACRKAFISAMASVADAGNVRQTDQYRIGVLFRMLVERDGLGPALTNLSAVALAPVDSADDASENARPYYELVKLVQ